MITDLRDREHEPERNRERERERRKEKKLINRLPPLRVQLEIGPVTFWYTGQCSNQPSRTARAIFIISYTKYAKFYKYKK